MDATVAPQHPSPTNLLKSQTTQDHNTDKASDSQSIRLSLYDIETTAKSKQRPLIYTEREYEMIEQFIEFATDSIKYQWNELKSTTTDGIKYTVEFVDSNNGGKGICIVRSRTIIHCKPEDFFIGYDDHRKIKDLDADCLDIRLMHKYDDHRRIISGSFAAPFPFQNREFLFKEMRALVDDQDRVIRHHIDCDSDDDTKCKNVKRVHSEKQIFDLFKEYTPMARRSSVCLAFSVGTKEDERPLPFEDRVRPKHARCDLKIGGYLFRSIGDNQCEVTYLVCMDLGGWIPKWITNLILPQQGTNVLRLKEYIEDLLERSKNTYPEEEAEEEEQGDAGLEVKLGCL